MNCHDCRKHLHPYLDSELEVQQNLDVLQHLNACPECARIFELEEASWEHARAALDDDGAAPAFRESIPALLAGVDRRETWRRAIGYVVPLGAAAALLVTLQLLGTFDEERLTDDTQTGPPTISVGHRHGLMHDHGPGVELAVGDFLGHLQDAKRAGHKLLSKSFFDTHGQFSELNAESARAEFLKLMGHAASVPSALRGKGIHGAMADREIDGTKLQSLLLADHKEQVYGLYVLDRQTAGVHDMHDLGSEGMRDDFVLDRCRSCNVITVTNGEKVFIFVTHAVGGVRPAIELVRETF